MKCLCCGSTTGVLLEDSRTAYCLPTRSRYERLLDNDPFTQEDPNTPIPLCRTCAKRHHEEWDAMWEEYYFSQVVALGLGVK